MTSTVAIPRRPKATASRSTVTVPPNAVRAARQPQRMSAQAASRPSTVTVVATIRCRGASAESVSSNTAVTASAISGESIMYGTVIGPSHYAQKIKREKERADGQPGDEPVEVRVSEWRESGRDAPLIRSGWLRALRELGDVYHRPHNNLVNERVQPHATE